MAQCTSKSKRSGQQCKNPAMPNGKCRMHGGKSVSGLAHPSTKHGRYSKDLPTRMLANFEAAAADPELLNLGYDIALVEARMIELVKRADSGESGRLWRELRSVYYEMRKAQRERRMGDFAALFDQLGDLISAGHSDSMAWGEAMQLVDTKRKLVESDQKRRIAMHDMVTGDQMKLVIATLINLVQTHVDDERAVLAIAEGLARHFGRPLDPGIDPA